MFNRPGALCRLALSVFFALALGAPTFVQAKDAKSYPAEGKIVATGLTEWVINRQHQYAHTYTVEAGDKRYVLECGHKPLFGTTGEECGGTKKLQIGDMIHFRLENDRVYIPITKTDNSTGEEKLKILSTELKPDAAGGKP